MIRAVGTLLARDGFQGMGVNAVAREAGVDKVLIARPTTEADSDE
ncbi:MAG: hypothetical protein ACNA8P_13365 [Phycisphaerales bacterium]